MSSKGKKLSIVLAIFMSLIFVLGVFFSSFVDKDSDKCDHEWYLFKTLTNVTCEVDGVMLVSCSHCSAFERRVIPALGHSLVGGTEPVFPTCTASGKSESLVCATCNRTLQYPETVPALGHDLVVVPGRPATCLETGLSDGQSCRRCEKVIVKQQTTYGDHVDENEDGICEVCNKATKCLHPQVDGSGNCSLCDMNIFTAPTKAAVVGSTASGWYRVKSGFGESTLTFGITKHDATDKLKLSDIDFYLGDVSEMIGSYEIYFNACNFANAGVNGWALDMMSMTFFVGIGSGEWVYFRIPDSHLVSFDISKTDAWDSVYVTLQEFVIKEAVNVEKVD